MTEHLGGLLNGVLVGAARRRIVEQFHGTRGSNILDLQVAGRPMNSAEQLCHTISRGLAGESGIAFADGAFERVVENAVRDVTLTRHAAFRLVREPDAFPRTEFDVLAQRDIFN